MRSELSDAYAKSTIAAAKQYPKWDRYSTQFYLSATHGQRYVNNYGNAKAKAYGKFENAGVLPVGAQLAKDSFLVSPNGQLSVGPLFLMEKMPSGFLKESGNWKYTMIMPTGSVFGETKGKNSAAMQFCIECHQAATDYDHLMFLPENYRRKN